MLEAGAPFSIDTISGLEYNCICIFMLSRSFIIGFIGYTPLRYEGTIRPSDITAALFSLTERPAFSVPALCS